MKRLVAVAMLAASACAPNYYVTGVTSLNNKLIVVATQDKDTQVFFSCDVPNDAALVCKRLAVDVMHLDVPVVPQ